MDANHWLFFSSLPQLVCVAVGITAALVAAGSYWRRSRLSTVTMRAAAPSKIIYHDAPTVRVVDSQRVDRMRKVVRLATGQYIDILETRPGLSPRFRIALKAIVARGEMEATHIAVEFGGTRVSCGPTVEEIGFNEFIVPRAVRDEPRSSILHYQENGDSLDFMRIKVRGIDAAAGTAELDVMQVSGHWPAA